ncbi:MAG TPA: tetratricopeptide repeat protein [Polyangiaceae bacterium]|nr:tetratricopeptide repeat protein [Polyangiaceae bacterium]
MRARIVSLSLAAALALTAAPPAAFAQPADAATRQAARKVAEEGLKLYTQGDFQGALEKFNLADSLVPAPTLAVQAARCLVKLNRLVEASERYLEAMRMKLDKFPPPVHKEAQVNALKERDGVLARIPTVEIRVEGPLGEGKVTIDGDDVPPALLGQKRPVNPGKHTITAIRPDTSVTREVTVAERETALTILKLPPLPPPPMKSVKNEEGEAQRIIGRIALGVGAGGLLAGGVNGVIALDKEGDLLKNCPDKICPPAQYKEVDKFNLHTTASTIGFIIGIASAGAGLALVLTAPPEYKLVPVKRTEVRASAYISPFGAGIRGEF